MCVAVSTAYMLLQAGFLRVCMFSPYLTYPFTVPYITCCQRSAIGDSEWAGVQRIARLKVWSQDKVLFAIVFSYPTPET